MCNKRFIYIVFVLLVRFFSIFSQNTDSIAGNLPSDIYPNLPPIHVLMDSAISHSFAIKSQDASVLIQQIKLANSKKQWTEYFNLSADCQYGLFDNVAANQFNTGVNNVLTSATSETRYGLGISVKLPIFSILSRNNNVTIAKKELELTKLKKEELESELRKAIITLYNDIILARTMVGIKANVKETSQLQLDFAESEYRIQKITIYDMSKAADAHAKNLAEYEKALYDLRVSIEIMKELTGINLQRYVQ